GPVRARASPRGRARRVRSWAQGSGRVARARARSGARLARAARFFRRRGALPRRSPGSGVARVRARRHTRRMPRKAERQVARVTGASGGIGEAIARRVAREGASVLVAARSRAECERVAASIRASGGEARALVLDVSDPESIAHALDEARALTGPFG